MADRSKVIPKRHDVELELLDYISEAIKERMPTKYLSELTLAYRYLEGGTQPGSVVVES
ncbi:hypothetical protein [Curtobacterium citreum]|uniref:hypothetical protein n=1 Tax=Curtobacterium citreum TaxID=2036 RepID=UPI000B04552F|nr:hypothetical protein [Curtobacterium citreum]